MSAGIQLAAMMAYGGWDRVRHLAAAGGDVEVSGAELVRDVGSEIPTAAGHVLVVMYSADRDDWRLDRLIGQAHTGGTVAVVLEGLAPLRRSTSALAERLGIWVLGTPDTVGTYQVLEALLGRPAVVTAELVLRVLAAARRAGAGAGDAVEAISSTLRRPTALVDIHGVTLFGTLGDAADSVSTVLEQEKVLVPGARRLTVPGGGQAIAYPLNSAGTLAWLVTVLPVEFAAEATAVESALTAASASIEQRLAATRLDLERDARQQTSVLGEILQGRVSEACRRRALDLGWNLEGWHTGIRIRVRQEDDLAGQRLEVVRSLAAAGVAAAVVEQGAGFAAWATSAQEPTAAQIHDQATALRRAQQRLATTLDADMGVGRVHPGPEGIGRSLNEATDAASLARNRPESGRFVHVDRLGLAQLLLAWTRTDTFQPAARALLASIAEEPGNLVLTLTAYLDSESSPADAAGVLGVHRNTVSARIARIEALLGVDLSVPDDRLALHLACRTALTDQPLHPRHDVR